MELLSYWKVAKSKCFKIHDHSFQILILRAVKSSERLTFYRKDFFIKLSYENTLPDVPCDPKHIVLPLDPLKFQLPALAMQPFYEQLLDNTCGVTLDLVGSTLNWKLPSSVSLEPEDALLLQDETEKGKSFCWRNCFLLIRSTNFYLFIYFRGGMQVKTK